MNFISLHYGKGDNCRNNNAAYYSTDGRVWEFKRRNHYDHKYGWIAQICWYTVDEKPLEYKYEYYTAPFFFLERKLPNKKMNKLYPETMHLKKH